MLLLRLLWTIMGNTNLLPNFSLWTRFANCNVFVDNYHHYDASSQCLLLQEKRHAYFYDYKFLDLPYADGFLDKCLCSRILLLILQNWYTRDKKRNYKWISFGILQYYYRIPLSVAKTWSRYCELLERLHFRLGIQLLYCQNFNCIF